MRKNIGGVLFLAAMTVSMAVSQEQVATISPQKPKVGDEIIITYNTASKAANLRNVKEITAEVLVMRDGEMPSLQEIPMKQSDKLWKGSFKLSDQKARVMLLRFSSGEMKDDNGENSWDVLVYGSNSQPLKGAHLQRASLLQRGAIIDFKVAKDMEGAKAELAKERELYPDNWAATTTSWSLLMREKPGDETKAAIKGELEKLYEAHKRDEEAVAGLLNWFEQTGQKERADEIRKSAVAANPKGKIAESKRQSEIFAERDGAKRLELLEQFLADFPQQGQMLENSQMMRINFLIQAQQIDKAATLLESMPKKDGGLYNELAWSLIEKGEQLDKAVAWAKRGVELLRNPDPATKPPYMSAVQWKKGLEMQLGFTLDTYAFGLAKMGKDREAEKAYEGAYALTKGGQPDINERVVECYVKNGNYSKAMATAVECVRKGKHSDKLVEQYKAAYIKAKGSEKGFDEALNEAKNLAKTDLRKEILKDRVNKPAVNFALKSLDGKTVRLSELKGKVVVVDFWATWCGPCTASFPFLQQVYEKYKANPNVVILTLNTWERVTGAEREALVTKFMEENKYTFPVLYDEGFVEKYGVEGIPTKFIIDKKGMIQFKSIGFMGGPKMIDEMTLQIEMLLDDNFYSSMN
jgi:thiol-disulfide isomerase/thioredoxin